MIGVKPVVFTPSRSTVLRLHITNVPGPASSTFVHYGGVKNSTLYSRFHLGRQEPEPRQYGRKRFRLTVSMLK